MSEQLTDEARQRLCRGEYRHTDVSEALRVIDGAMTEAKSERDSAREFSRRVRDLESKIDAHAADRAALVAQLAELTRERDEARQMVAVATLRMHEAEQQAHEFKDMYECEKLSVHQVCERAEAAEARVRELAEREERNHGN